MADIILRLACHIIFEAGELLGHLSDICPPRDKLTLGIESEHAHVVEERAFLVCSGTLSTHIRVLLCESLDDGVKVAHVVVFDRGEVHSSALNSLLCVGPRFNISCRNNLLRNRC